MKEKHGIDIEAMVEAECKRRLLEEEEKAKKKQPLPPPDYAKDLKEA